MTDQSGQAGVARVVVGVDGSDSALHAVRWAAREAHARGVPLTVVHALHLPDAAVAPLEPVDFAERQEAAGRDLLASAAALIGTAYPELKVVTESTPGSPVHRLIELSAPDTLVVTGTRGHGGFVGMLLGSVSRALAGHAEGPLAVVRGSDSEHPVGDSAGGSAADQSAIGPVVLGVGPEAAEPAIEFAFDTARRYGASVRVVRAWWPVTPLMGAPMAGGVLEPGFAAPGVVSVADAQDGGEREATWAKDAIDPVRALYPDVAVQIRAVAGNPVPVLTEASQDASLVVLGAHRRRLLFSIGAGYVVEGLLSHCPAPVAVVPMRAVDESAAAADDSAEPSVRVAS
jgi:nucleotide-binding universal stress UspA family protein